jgi:FKBP-type peptidyl-prolyl cis-trans isomerase
MSASRFSFAQDQSAFDEKTLKDYFTKNHIEASRTPSGLYYVITKKGSGEKAKAGQTVSVNYIGKFMDGKVFDATVDEKGQYVNGRTAINFSLGQGQVIKGWDEGIQLLNPGCKATLYIPSGLAYGAMDRGPIPANSILVFDVELLSASN